MSELTARHRGEVKPAQRHRADEPITSPGNTAPLRIVPAEQKHHGQHRAPVHHKTAISLATGGLMVMSTLTAVAAPAAAPSKAEVRTETETGAMTLIQADSAVVVKAEKVSVTTQAAPPPPPPPPPVVEEAPAPVYVAPAPVRAPAPPPPPAPPAYSNKAAIIANAALSQLGRIQDCTMLATNALAAAGVYFHGWPAGYFSLGAQVPASAAVPGDLIYYANGGMGVAHIAVYVGNGLAVHGGWNGNQTVTFSANVGSGPVFIRVS